MTEAGALRRLETLCARSEHSEGELLEKMRIRNPEEVLEKYPHQLSGGMKQRVAIAKALALKPQIILMDEPFASLDAMTRNHLQEELMKLHQKEKVTVIFITHNIQEAVCLGTRILVMAKQGGIKMDVPNTIPKPVTPASEGYGQMWDMFNKALHQEG